MASPPQNTVPSSTASTSSPSQQFQMRTIGQTLVGIPEFSGKPNENINEFFSKLSQRAKIDAWTEVQTLAVAKYQLTGDAFRFLESEPQLNTDDISYTVFKNAFIKKYSRKIIPGQGAVNLAKCYQRAKENVDQYATRLKVVGKQLLEENLSYVRDNDEAEKRAIKNRHERDLIQQFQKGVNEEISKLIMMDICQHPQYKFEEVIDLAQKAETSISILYNARKSNDLFMVRSNNFERNQRYPNQNISRYNSPNKRYETSKCYNCGDTGHYFKDCKRPRNKEKNYYDKRNEQPNQDEFKLGPSNFKRSEKKQDSLNSTSYFVESSKRRTFKEEPESNLVLLTNIFNLNGNNNKNIFSGIINILSNNNNLNILIDTGAAVTIIKEKVIRENRGTIYANSNNDLRGISGNKLDVVGFATVQFQIGDMYFSFECVVCEDSLPLPTDGLFGRDILKALNANIDFSKGHVMLAGMEFKMENPKNMEELEETVDYDKNRSNCQENQEEFKYLKSQIYQDKFLETERKIVKNMETQTINMVEATTQISSINVDEKQIEVVNISNEMNNNLKEIRNNEEYKIKEIESDLFKMSKQYALVNCVSEDFKMNRGIAKEFRKRFGRVEELMQENVTTSGLAVLEIKERYYRRFIYYLVTKKSFWNKPTLINLEKSLNALREHCLQNNVSKLAMPKIGCGLDRLKWSSVKRILENIFKSTNIEVVICKLDQSKKIENQQESEIMKESQRIDSEYHIVGNMNEMCKIRNKTEHQKVDINNRYKVDEKKKFEERRIEHIVHVNRLKKCYEMEDAEKEISKSEDDEENDVEEKEEEEVNDEDKGRKQTRYLVNPFGNEDKEIIMEESMPNEINNDESQEKLVDLTPFHYHTRSRGPVEEPIPPLPKRI